MKKFLLKLGLLGTTLSFLNGCANQKSELHATGKTEYTKGVLTMYDDRGNKICPVILFRKLETKPNDGKVLEKSGLVQPKAACGATQTNVDRYNWTIKVAGDDSFTMKDAVRDGSGKGNFTKGPRWDWTHWNTSYDFKEDGENFTQTTDFAKQDGSYKVEIKLIHKGRTLLSFKGALAETTKGEYEKLDAKYPKTVN